MSDRLSAGDVCTRHVTFAERRTPITEAAQLMREHHVGALVVVDETVLGRMVVGLLTDRDIVTSIVAKGVNPAIVTVGDAMTTDLVTAHEQDSLIDALALMRRHGVRRLPIVEPNGVLIGLLALDDVLEIVAEELQLMVQAIASGRKREPAIRP